jgi:hypothetical protein
MIHTRTAGYNSWLAMKQRCYYPKHKDYANYGGRGITVCDRWRNSFPNFIADMGERPDGLTLERRDTHGNYEPTNCYWATHKEQVSNRRQFFQSPQSSTPFISTMGKYSYQLTITITRGLKYHKTCKDLAKLELIRDTCIYEREFLKLRGLTYD